MPDAAGEAAPDASWVAREHRLDFARQVTGGEREGERWVLRWRAAALMGVLNVTPDSFSDGGRLADSAAAVEAGLGLWREGAAFVDVGGESTRPGAEPVPEEEEMRRVLPVVAGLAGHGVRVSIDTLKPRVAREALAAGAVLVNDIRGLTLPGMRRACAEAGAPAVIMHMQGEPRTMQRAPHYRHVVEEVEAALLARARTALEDGVPAVLLDPGIGFGKTPRHNLALLAATGRLAGHGVPLVVGASRKSLVSRVAGEAPPLARLPGSLAMHLYSAERGAALLRVHDVAEHRQALALLQAVAEAEAAGEGGRGG